MLTMQNVKKAKTVLHMKLRETQGTNFKEAKGEYQDRVHPDQKVLVIVRR
jgi:hypothetical protein